MKLIKLVHLSGHDEFIPTLTYGEEGNSVDKLLQQLLAL
jgi:hypothetical protein